MAILPAAKPYTQAVGTPNAAIGAVSTLSDMGVEAGLRLDAINKKLQMESTLDDIFEDLSEVVESHGTEAIEIPNSIFMKLDAVETGARTVTVPILSPLGEELTIGAGTPIGNEENQRLKYARFYYNEYSHAVPSESWGINANDMAMYGVFEKIQPQLSKYMKEVRGQRIRESSLLRHDAVVGDLAGISQMWNQNWFVPNTDLGSQPAFDDVEQTFTDNIGTVLDAAGGAAAEIDLPYLHALGYYAANVLRITPIYIDGKPMYVLCLPSTQVNLLRRAEAGKLGQVFTEMNRSNENIMKYNGVVGVVDNLIIVEDQRYPEIEVTDAALTYSIEAKFLWAGNNDYRDKTAYVDATNRSWDVGFLYGAGAICEWEVRPLHFEKEVQDFGRQISHGVFGESGISIVEWDDDTADGTVRRNYGSIVCPFSTPTLVS